ncbi:hypothetical protein PG997_003810 [Apiospora hydei]|uniref:Uncharacterized protein n=1 Tax=Apiospora hydei TaxID=1337664 RepID=A0ABR1X0H4_9PEZI
MPIAFPFHYIIRLASTSMRKQKRDAKERIAVLGFRQPARPGLGIQSATGALDGLVRLDPPSTVKDALPDGRVQGGWQTVEREEPNDQ